MASSVWNKAYLQVIHIISGVVCIVTLSSSPLTAETGHDLWLRYVPIKDSTRRHRCRRLFTHIVAPGQSETMRALRYEAVTGLSGLLDTSIAACDTIDRSGGLVIETPGTVSRAAEPSVREQLPTLGSEGFRILSTHIRENRATIVAANTEVGALYGVYTFLRMIQTNQPLDSIDYVQRPYNQYRFLNHWDNMDGSIERGYAGRSLWFGPHWKKLPDTLPSRLRDYARANASIGINGTILNNVNADSEILKTHNLDRVAAIADLLRPYGIRIGLTARFSAPMEIGGIGTADPHNENVRQWWRHTAARIYKRIPDFIGFVVKANSEGQPGPQNYDRTHADGANCLARALAPHDGIVMWRAFVYGDADPDRAKRAYNTFMPLDGLFEDNVIVQVKSGPIDFQPREPAHPLFGAMTQTNIMMECQITQEYLGHATDLVYLAPMWKEVLDFDTYARGRKTTVARILHDKATGCAGVSNIGSDDNWCGHHFAPANWYAYGRLVWDPALEPETIADEWTRMTFTNDSDAVAVIRSMMMRSHQATVDYTMPLGLHHLMIPGGSHAMPAPELNTGYHGADKHGIGYDRTSGSGSNAVSQYSPEVASRFDSLHTCPLKYLLWFHHLPYDYPLSTGRTVIHELYARYNSARSYCAGLKTDWHAVRPFIDSQRYEQVMKKLDAQQRHANHWREVCVSYFEDISGCAPDSTAVEECHRTLETERTGAGAR